MIHTGQRPSVRPVFEMVLSPSVAGRHSGLRAASFSGTLACLTQSALSRLHGAARQLGRAVGRADSADYHFVKEAAAALAEIIGAIDESEATGSARRAEDAIRREAQAALDWIIGQGTRVRPDMAPHVARRVRELASLVVIAGHADGAEHAARLRRLLACGYGRDERDWPKAPVN